MKKNVLALLTILPALALSSCGGNNNGGDKIYWKDTGHLTFDDDGQVIFDDVEITVRTICNSLDANKFEGLVSQFNRLNIGIKVNFTKDGQGSYYNNLGRMISQDLETVPELCMFHNERIASLQQSHFFQPIGRIFEKMNLDPQIDNYCSNTLTNNYIDEDLYGLPIDAHTEVIVYRKDLLEKYSLEVPQNYEQFVNAAKTIQEGERVTNKNFYGASIPSGAFGITQYAFNTAVYQNGGTFIDKDKMPNWDKDPAIKTSLMKLHDLYYGDNKIAKSGTVDTSADTDFTAGNTAFAFVYSWNLYNDLDARYGAGKSMESDEWGIMNMEKIFASDPTKDYASSQFAISHSFFIPRTIKDITKKAAACYFANWFSTQASSSWSEAGHVPQFKDVLNSEEYKNKDITKRITSNYGNPSSFKNFPNTNFFSETADSLQALVVETLLEPNPNYDSLIKDWNTQAKNKILSALE